MNKLPYVPTPQPLMSAEDMERILVAESKRLATILDIHHVDALRSLRNLIDNGLVELR